MRKRVKPVMYMLRCSRKSLRERGWNVKLEIRGEGRESERERELAFKRNKLGRKEKRESGRLGVETQAHFKICVGSERLQL